MYGFANVIEDKILMDTRTVFTGVDHRCHGVASVQCLLSKTNAQTSLTGRVAAARGDALQFRRVCLSSPAECVIMSAYEAFRSALSSRN